MGKKYFKYIISIIAMIFIFNTNVYAATEQAKITTSSTKIKYCKYKYSNFEMDFVFLEDGTAKLLTSGSIQGSTYEPYVDGSDISQWNSNGSCPSFDVYKQEWTGEGTPGGDIKTNLKYSFYINGMTPENVKEDWNNEGYEYEKKLSGSMSTAINKCIYSAFGATMTAEYTLNTKNVSVTHSYSGNDGQTVNINSSVKKNWKYNDNGLVCRNDIVIDKCVDESGYDATGIISKIDIRTSANRICSGATKSTGPIGINVSISDKEATEADLTGFSNICINDNNVRKVVRFFGYVLIIAKILVPIALIGFGIKEFAGVIVSGNNDGIAKAAKNFAFKIISAIIVFVLPTIVYFIIGMIDGATEGTGDYEDCNNCLFHPGDCSIK